MFEICREMLKEKEHAKWASHVSYSNDVLLVDEKVPALAFLLSLACTTCISCPFPSPNLTPHDARSALSQRGSPTINPELHRAMRLSAVRCELLRALAHRADPMAAVEQTHRPVEYSNGRAVGELPSGFTRPA